MADYVNNKSLLREILISQEKLNKYPKEQHKEMAAQCLTKELTEMLMLMVDKYASSMNWRGYSWVDDMRAEAYVNLCQNALKFNLEKAGPHPNPFGYFTQIIKRDFIVVLNKEKRQGSIKDEIISTRVDSDMLPSFGKQYQEVYDQNGNNLDGTKRVPPIIGRRRKRPKVCKEDNTHKMDDIQFAEWLEKKKQEFYQK